MSRLPLNIITKTVTSISRGVHGITLRTTVKKGPASTVNRTVETFLYQDDISFVLSTLATMPAYRDVFRAIADELDTREAIVNNPDSRPVEKMNNSVDSHATSSAISRIIANAVREG